MKKVLTNIEQYDIINLLLREIQNKRYSGVEQLVARKAHNLEVAGSSPVPAPTIETVHL